MDLHTFRTTVARVSRAKAGEVLGLDGITVWRHETGRSYPAPALQQRIIQWSGGRVTADDMLNTYLKAGETSDSEGGEP